MIKSRSMLIIGLVVLTTAMLRPSILTGKTAVTDDLLGDAGRKEAGNEQFNTTNLPTALYSMLVEDYAFLKGEQFKGSLNAARIISLPPALRSMAKKGNRLLVASTLRKGYRVYVIIPSEEEKYFRDRIKKRRRIYITYTPAGLYAQAPVLIFTGNIGEPEKGAKKGITGELVRFYPAVEGAEWRIMIGNNLRVLTYKIEEIKGSTARGSVRESSPGGTEPDKVNTLLIVYDSGSITVIEGGADNTGQQFKSSDLVLKAPLRIGTRWDVQRENQVKKREIVAINTSVSIEGRQYNDILVVREDSTIKVDEQKQYYAATYYFYGGGIGFIGCKITAADTPASVKTYDTIDDWFIKRIE